MQRGVKQMYDLLRKTDVRFVVVEQRLGLSPLLLTDATLRAGHSRCRGGAVRGLRVGPVTELQST